MEANTTTASAAITSTPRITPGRSPEGVQSRSDQGDSSAAFSQRTNVSIETAIDHMADVLSKISGRQQTNVQQMPAELKEVIQNMIRQSFSIETTLGQGLGSTAASQRFSTDQLTTLARMLNQLGTMAETEGSIPRVGDDLAALLTGLKSVLAKDSGGTFEPIMLTKAAFQLLDTGNAELLPKELQTFLAQLNTQGASAGTAGRAGATSLSFLNQLVQLLMPRDPSGTATAPQPTNANMQGQLLMPRDPSGSATAPQPTNANMQSSLLMPRDSSGTATAPQPTNTNMQGQPLMPRDSEGTATAPQPTNTNVQGQPLMPRDSEGTATAPQPTNTNVQGQPLMPRDSSGTATAPQPTNVSMHSENAQNSPAPTTGGQEARPSSSGQITNANISEDGLPEQQITRTQTGTASEVMTKDNMSAAVRQPANMPQETAGKAAAEMPQQNSGKGASSASAQSNPSPAQNTPTASEAASAQKTTVNDSPGNKQKATMNEPLQTGRLSERGQNPVSHTGNTNIPAQTGKELTGSMTRQGEPSSVTENKAASEAGTRTFSSTGTQMQTEKSALQGERAAQIVRPQAGGGTENANAAKMPTQPSAQMKSSEIQNTIPRFFTQAMENTPQTMNVLRNLAQTLLQNENLSQRETVLLQNFVNGRSQTMSEGDAKQLQQLIQLTQQNIPGTVRQAAFEQQLPDLPRLWAFMQMTDMVKTRKMTAEQYKRAGRDVAALALTMRNALEGENAAPQPGQRSMNFVMPLFVGTSEYPAYIHVYDESHKDEETDRIKKETWLRICVLTDNIGTVELINRIYEENHVDIRLYFSDADAAWEFRNALDSIRETADGTALVIEGIQIGAIGERRFFTN